MSDIDDMIVALRTFFDRHDISRQGLELAIRLPNPRTVQIAEYTFRHDVDASQLVYPALPEIIYAGVRIRFEVIKSA